MEGSSVKEITGDRIVEKVKVEDTKTGNTNIIKADAVFVAIGYKPNNDIAEKLGLKIDEEGYIKVDDKMRTSMPFVYAAVDITGGVKQQEERFEHMVIVINNEHGVLLMRCGLFHVVPLVIYCIVPSSTLLTFLTSSNGETGL